MRAGRVAAVSPSQRFRALYRQHLPFPVFRTRSLMPHRTTTSEKGREAPFLVLLFFLTPSPPLFSHSCLTLSSPSPTVSTTTYDKSVLNPDPDPSFRSYLPLSFSVFTSATPVDPITDLQVKQSCELNIQDRSRRQKSKSHFSVLPSRRAMMRDRSRVYTTESARRSPGKPLFPFANNTSLFRTRLIRLQIKSTSFESRVGRKWGRGLNSFANLSNTATPQYAAGIESGRKKKRRDLGRSPNVKQTN